MDSELSKIKLGLRLPLIIILLCLGACLGNNDQPKPGIAAKPEIIESAQSIRAPVASAPAAQIVEPAPTRPADQTKIPEVPVRDVESTLSPGALETYAYLLFVQALLSEDEAALLESAGLLKKYSPPANVWLDGGAWLMGRKSPNSVVFLEQALQALPDDLSLSLLYAEALGEHGMAKRGIESMRNYLAKYPDALDARLELALLLVRDHQFTEAEDLLNAISGKQRTALVDYYHARALIGMGRRAEAIPFLRKATKGMPDFVEALNELAFSYEQLGDLRNARACYEKLAKLQFSPQEVALRLVALSLRLNQPDKALQFIRQGPDTTAFKIMAANMLMEARHYLQAESLLKQIANSRDTPADVFLLLADLAYLQRHDLTMALSWLDKVPPASKTAPRAKVLRVQLLAEGGKLEEALNVARAAQKEFPKLTELRDFEIKILARQKKLPEAIAKAREALALWPDNGDLAFLLGSLLDESGQKQEALAVMEKLLKSQPDNFQALNYIGYTLAEQNRDLDHALKLLRRADELSPNQAFILDSLAWALHKSGRTKEALEKIRRALSLGESNDPTIWEHYGEIASKFGNRDEARKAYQKAIDLKPANAKSLRQKLSQL